MSKKQAGFTIIEVLIATLVFTFVLLICLQGVTLIGKVYYKGVSQSRAQEFARTMSDEIIQQIQFGSTIPTLTTIPPSGVLGGQQSVFCIGDNRYQLTLNRQVDGTNSALLREPKTTAVCDTAAPFNNAQEVVPRGMRLTKFNVRQDAVNPAIWSMEIKVIFGDEDLLDFPVGNRDEPSVFEIANCTTGISGSQYCAVSEVQTSIMRRVGAE